MKIQFDKTKQECVQDYHSMTWKDLFKKYGLNQYTFVKMMGPKPRLKQAFTDGRVCNKCGVFKVWDNFSISKNGYNKKSSVCKECTSIHYTRQRPSFKKINPEAMGSDRILNSNRWNNPPVEYGDWRPGHADLFNKILY